MIEERADIALRHAFEGYGISYEDALKLLKESEDLTNEQRVDRDILLAALDNITDFVTAEEYQMVDDFPDFEDYEVELEEGEDLDTYLEELFALYNKRYAWVENLDIEFAMAMAAYLAKLKEDIVLMYMTMGDERVRPWHLQYEGFTAPKSSFPEWLIPPIEHNCRCYLVEEAASSVIGSVKAAAEKKYNLEIPDWFNRTFKESVAKGGRIFSDEHPYFQIDKKHMKRLSGISQRIKDKYLSNG